MGHKGTCEFITCNACGAVTEVERVLVGARWAAIVAEKRTEQWDAEDAGWNASLESYGVQVVGPGPEWRGRVGFYLRDCANGHALTGMAAVLVTDPQGSGLAVGKRVDVQAWTLRKLPERSITEIVADIRAGK
jgi:NAD(P)H-flavin reductase